MARSVDSAAQRRKLLGEIARLAEIAIFGTLSETYRTCGQAGCHCQGDGPKHGPHLNVSYPGRRARPPATMFPRERRRPRAKESPLGRKCRNVYEHWQS